MLNSIDKNRKKKIKKALSRSHSRDTDSELNDVTSKTKTKNKKWRSQSSESVDENEVRGRRQRKLGRTKSRDTDGSNNSLDTITESPKTVAKSKTNAENKDNSKLMKQRSTKRWRLFGGTKPKLRSVDKDAKSSNEDLTGKKQDEKKLKKDAEAKPLKNGTVALKEKGENQAKPGEEHPKTGLTRTVSKDATALADRKGRTGVTPITETYTKSTLRKLNSQESSPKPLRNSLRKPSELRATQNTGFTRSISSGAATVPRAGPMKRTNSDIKETEKGLTRQTKDEKKTERKTDKAPGKTSEETGAEKENKRAKLDIKSRAGSVLDNIKR